MWVGGSSDDFDNEAAESMVLVLVGAIRLVGGSSRSSGERRRERKVGETERDLQFLRRHRLCHCKWVRAMGRGIKRGGLSCRIGRSEAKFCTYNVCVA